MANTNNHADVVTLTLGNGEAKKHSVRFEVLHSDDREVQQVLLKYGLPDMYVPRSILYSLGVQDYEQVTVTFERAAQDKKEAVHVGHGR